MKLFVLYDTKHGNYKTQIKISLFLPSHTCRISFSYVFYFTLHPLFAFFLLTFYVLVLLSWYVSYFLLCLRLPNNLKTFMRKKENFWTMLRNIQGHFLDFYEKFYCWCSWMSWKIDESKHGRGIHSFLSFKFQGDAREWCNEIVKHGNSNKNSIIN